MSRHFPDTAPSIRRPTTSKHTSISILERIAAAPVISADGDAENEIGPGQYLCAAKHLANFNSPIPPSRDRVSIPAKNTGVVPGE